MVPSPTPCPHVWYTHVIPYIYNIMALVLPVLGEAWSSNRLPPGYTKLSFDVAGLQDVVAVPFSLRDESYCCSGAVAVGRVSFFSRFFAMMQVTQGDVFFKSLSLFLSLSLFSEFFRQTRRARYC